eukprot:Gb_37285 [translate_table: standard]
MACACCIFDRQLLERKIDEFIASEIQHRTSPCIWRVPKTLRKGHDAAYVPQVIALGPYHFSLRKETEEVMSPYSFSQSSVRFDEVDAIELLKTEATRKMRLRKGDDKFFSMVEMIREKMKKIMDDYDILQEKWNTLQLGSIVVQNVCFVLEVLTKFSNKQVREDEDRDWPRIDSILNRKRHHPLWNEIVKDMLKMEKQLPLWLLREVIQMNEGIEEHRKVYEDYFESALYKLSPFLENGHNESYRPRDLCDIRHMLELLHSYIVREPSQCSARESEQTLFHQIYSKLRIIYFFPCIVVNQIWRSYVKDLHVKEIPSSTAHRKRIRSVESLKILGIKFENCDGGISNIDFDIYKFIVKLPHLRIDRRSEVMLRNLIAFELLSSSMEEKPVTRYVHFMSDLLCSGKDVFSLQHDGIITNHLGSDEEVSQMLDSITKSTETTTFAPIDAAERGLNIYCKRRWQVKWAQFRYD